MSNYVKEEKERIARMNAQTAHDFHRIEFREMAAQMIDDALRQHDQQIEVDVKTRLNGKPVSMRGLASDIRELVYDSIRKAFRN